MALESACRGGEKDEEDSWASRVGLLLSFLRGVRRITRATTFCISLRTQGGFLEPAMVARDDRAQAHTRRETHHHHKMLPDHRAATQL